MTHCGHDPAATAIARTAAFAVFRVQTVRLWCRALQSGNFVGDDWTRNGLRLGNELLALVARRAGWSLELIPRGAFG
jgi:hypothetical protein